MTPKTSTWATAKDSCSAALEKEYLLAVGDPRLTLPPGRDGVLPLGRCAGRPRPEAWMP